MKKNNKLIFEYAKLAALELKQGQKTITLRMKQIENELLMTGDAIIKRATELATASFK